MNFLPASHSADIGGNKMVNVTDAVLIFFLFIFFFAIFRLIVRRFFNVDVTLYL